MLQTVQSDQAQNFAHDISQLQRHSGCDLDPSATHPIVAIISVDVRAVRVMAAGLILTTPTPPQRGEDRANHESDDDQGLHGAPLLPTV